MNSDQINPVLANAVKSIKENTELCKEIDELSNMLLYFRH